MATAPGLILLGMVYATSSDTAVKLDAVQVSGEEGVWSSTKLSSACDPSTYILISCIPVHCVDVPVHCPSVPHVIVPI